MPLSFGITPQKEKALRDRMTACGVCEEDLEERFIRGGGPGGQKVNKSATCVWLRHAPSGTEVKMQQERSQAMNRYYARKRMCEMLEAGQLGELSPEALRQEKIRKQKARRKRRGGKKAE